MTVWSMCRGLCLLIASMEIGHLTYYKGQEVEAEFYLIKLLIKFQMIFFLFPWELYYGPKSVFRLWLKICILN